jgi:NAD(P)H-hydrate epimerase
MAEAGGPGAAVLDDATVAGLLPERPARGHKGTFGKLLVVAGSLDYAGAALLACRAAGRAGAGLVTLAVPASLQPLFAAKVVEATTIGLPEHEPGEVDPDAAVALLVDHDHDAIVIGPGLRPGLATRDFVVGLLAVPPTDDPGPAVVDAEALRALASVDGWWTAVLRSCIVTPHPGEFVRLRVGSGHEPAAEGDLGVDDAVRLATAVDAAAQWRSIVVLKGARTVIAAPDGRAAVAPFENPALASGGTGDVLAGVLGAFLAQGVAPFDAARLAVYLHGLAGEAVSERIGDAGLLASDLPDQVPIARRRLGSFRDRRRAGFGAREPA